MTLFRERIAGIEVLRRPGIGGKVPMVLLHGIGSNAETWAPVTTALDPTIEALAWDAPGYGDSLPLAEAAPTPSHYADQLQLVLDRLGWDRIVLVGHSLGTLFASRYAATYPDRVLGLALLSPSLGYGVAQHAMLPPQVQARIDDLTALGPTAFAAKRAPRLVHRPEAKPEILASVQRAMAAVRPEGYAQAVRALGAGTLLDDARRIQAPCLVAVGVQDVVTPPDNARVVHNTLANRLPLELVEGSGHALPQEDPHRVARLLSDLMLEARHD